MKRTAAVFSVLLAGMLSPAHEVKPIAPSLPTVNALGVTNAGFAKDGKAAIPSGGEGYGLRICALPGLVEAVKRSRACIYARTEGNQTHWALVGVTWGQGSWFNSGLVVLFPGPQLHRRGAGQKEADPYTERVLHPPKLSSILRQ